MLPTYKKWLDWALAIPLSFCVGFTRYVHRGLIDPQFSLLARGTTFNSTASLFGGNPSKFIVSVYTCRVGTMMIPSDELIAEKKLQWLALVTSKSQYVLLTCLSFVLFLLMVTTMMIDILPDIMLRMLIFMTDFCLLSYVCYQALLLLSLFFTLFFLITTVSLLQHC